MGLCCLCVIVCKATSEGSFALFSMTGPSTVAPIRSFTRTFAVPLITPSVPIRYLPPPPSHSAPSAAPLQRPIFYDTVPRTVRSTAAFYEQHVRYPVRPEVDETWYNSSSGRRTLNSVSGSGPSLAAAMTVLADAGSYIIYMRPAYERAVADVVKHYAWKDVHFVYDSDVGKSTQLCLKEAMASREVFVIVSGFRMKRAGGRRLLCRLGNT